MFCHIKKELQATHFETVMFKPFIVIFVLTVTRIIFFYIRDPMLSWYINGAVKLIVDVK